MMNTKNTGTKEINYDQYTVRFGGWIEVNATINAIKCKKPLIF